MSNQALSKEGALDAIKKAAKDQFPEVDFMRNHRPIEIEVSLIKDAAFQQGTATGEVTIGPGPITANSCRVKMYPRPGCGTGPKFRVEKLSRSASEVDSGINTTGQSFAAATLATAS